jgi:hypothetical protein
VNSQLGRNKLENKMHNKYVYVFDDSV